jgi:transcription antitermination factor NusG
MRLVDMSYRKKELLKSKVLADVSKSWFVIYTNSRQEIKVTDRLKAIGIEAYCPTINEVKFYSDRKKKIERPILFSYVFVRLNEKERSLVFQIPGVVRYVFWLGKPAIVKQQEIDILKNNINGTYSDIIVSNLEKGDNLLISSGPFKNNNGTVISVNKNKIRLALPGLGVLLTLSK